MVPLVALIGIYLMEDNVDHLLMYCCPFTYLLQCDVSLNFFSFVLDCLFIVDDIVDDVRYRYRKYFPS